MDEMLYPLAITEESVRMPSWHAVCSNQQSNLFSSKKPTGPPHRAAFFM